MPWEKFSSAVTEISRRGSLDRKRGKNFREGCVARRCFLKGYCEPTSFLSSKRSALEAEQAHRVLDEVKL